MSPIGATVGWRTVLVGGYLPRPQRPRHPARRSPPLRKKYRHAPPLCHQALLLSTRIRSMCHHVALVLLLVSCPNCSNVRWMLLQCGASGRVPVPNGTRALPRLSKRTKTPTEAPRNKRHAHTAPCMTTITTAIPPPPPSRGPRRDSRHQPLAPRTHCLPPHRLIPTHVTPQLLRMPHTQKSNCLRDPPLRYPTVAIVATPLSAATSPFAAALFDEVRFCVDEATGPNTHTHTKQSVRWRAPTPPCRRPYLPRDASPHNAPQHGYRPCWCGCYVGAPPAGTRFAIAFLCC